jgi:hypothetical protein
MDSVHGVEDRNPSARNPFQSPRQDPARPASGQAASDTLDQAANMVAFSAEAVAAGQARAGLSQVLAAQAPGLASLSAGHALDPARVAGILSDPLLQDL